MLSVVFALPVVFAVAIRRSYRRERRAAERGEAYEPDGRVRW